MASQFITKRELGLDPESLGLPTFSVLDEPIRRRVRLSQPGYIPDVKPTYFSSFTHLVGFPFHLLGKTFEILDIPRNLITSTLAGQPLQKTSGRDLLEKLGILDRNKQGLDFGDVLGFAADVILDPLTYLTFGLSKTGKLVKSGQDVLATLQAAERFKQVTQGIKQSKVFDKVIRESKDKLGEVEKALNRSVSLEEIPERGFNFFGKEFGRFQKKLIKPDSYVNKLLTDKFKFLPTHDFNKQGFDLMNRALRKEIYDIEDELGATAQWFKDRGKTPKEIAEFMELYFTPDPDVTQIDRLNEMLAYVEELTGEAEVFNKNISLKTGKFITPKKLKEVEKRLGISGESLSAKDIKDELRRQIDHIKNLEAQWDPKELSVIKDMYVQTHDDLLKNMDIGVHETILRNRNIGYLHHLITPTALAITRNNKELQEVIIRKIDTVTKENFAAKKRTLAGPIKEINKTFRELPEVIKWAKNNGISIHDVKYFEDDVFKAVAARANSSAGRFYEKVYLQGVFNNFAEVSVDSAGKRIKEVMTLPEFLARENFRSWGDVKFKGLSGLTSAGRTRKIAKALKDAGHDINIGINKTLFADAKHPFRKIIQGDSRFWNAYDKVHGFYKGMFTVLFPQFHARNLQGNLWNSLAYGGGSISGHIQGAKILSSIKMAVREGLDPKSYLTKEQAKWFDLALETGIIRNEKQYLEYLFDIGDLVRAEETSSFFRKALSTGHKVGHDIETGSRLGHFISRLNKGDTSTEAAASVRKYLFNYDELTPFEKMKMKRLFFFYTFTRKNTPLVFENLFNPYTRAWASLTGKTKEKPEEMPDWMWETNMLYRGLDEAGRAQGINLGFPLNDPFETLTKPVSSLTPLLAAPAQLAINYDFFKGKPLSEDTVAPKLFQSMQKMGEKIGFHLPPDFLNNAFGIRTDKKGVVRFDPTLKASLRFSPIGRLVNLDFTEPLKAIGLFSPLSFSFGTPEKLTKRQKRSVAAAAARGEIRPFEIMIGTTRRGKAMAKVLNE